MDTPVNMTVILFTAAGMPVKSIEVPEVLACAVARVTREPVEEVQADPVEVSTLPVVPGEVSPVPPFAAMSVPARVTAPVVAVEGVKPVVPAEKDATIFGEDVQLVPFDVRTLPDVPGKASMGLINWNRVPSYTTKVTSPILMSAAASAVAPSLVRALTPRLLMLRVAAPLFVAAATNETPADLAWPHARLRR